MKVTISRFCFLFALCLSISACTDTVVSDSQEDETDDVASAPDIAVNPLETNSDDIEQTDSTAIIVDTAPAIPSDAQLPATSADSAPPLNITTATTAPATVMPATAEPAATPAAPAATPDAESPTAATSAPATAADTDLPDATETSEALSDETTDTSAEPTPELATVTDSTDPVVDPALTTDLPEETGVNSNIAAEGDTLADAASETTEPAIVAAAPGASVDCQQAVPCTWLSADSQFMATVTNVDNIGAQGRLAIQYQVTSLHDTIIQIVATEPAFDDSGNTYTATRLLIGENTGGVPQEVLAGDELQAGVEFDRTARTQSLDSWGIALSDAGVTRTPQFTNLKIGSANDVPADCEFILPCAWQSPSGDATITLLSVSGLGTTSQLSVNFSIETTKTTVVAVDTGATALGTDAQQYTGRTHAIGIENSGEKLTAPTVSGALISGTVFFFRTLTISPDLQNLSLVVYEDQPVPRWNPTFTSVPVQ